MRVCAVAGGERGRPEVRARSDPGLPGILAALFGSEDGLGGKEGASASMAIRGSGNGRAEDQTVFMMNPNVGARPTKAQRSQSGQGGHCRNAGKLCRAEV